MCSDLFLHCHDFYFFRIFQVLWGSLDLLGSTMKVPKVNPVSLDFPPDLRTQTLGSVKMLYNEQSFLQNWRRWYLPSMLFHLPFPRSLPHTLPTPTSSKCHPVLSILASYPCVLSWSSPCLTHPPTQAKSKPTHPCWGISGQQYDKQLIHFNHKDLGRLLLQSRVDDNAQPMSGMLGKSKFRWPKASSGLHIHY